MKARIFILSTALFYCLTTLPQAQQKPDLAPEKKVVDKYYGLEITDNYRYLENLEDAKVIDWIKQNADYARAQIDAIKERKVLLDRFLELDNRKEATISNLSITENDHYFYLKRKANEENGKLYFRVGYQGNERLLFDPETYKKDTQQNFSISSISPNEKGDKVAITITPNGSENAEILIIDTNGIVYSDVIGPCWFPMVSWLPDGNSFTYNRLNSADVKDPNRVLNTKVYFHKLGDDFKNDVEFFSNKTNPELHINSKEYPLVFFHKTSKRFFALARTVDRRLKIFTSKYTTTNLTPTKWTILTTEEDEIVDFQPNENTIFYRTFKNAPNFKIIKVPLEAPSLDNAKVVVPENKNVVLDQFKLTKDGLYYTTLVNGVESKAYFLSKGTTSATQIQLPFTAGSIDLNAISDTASSVWLTLSGWTSTTKRYLFDVKNQQLISQPLTKQIEYSEFANIVSQEVTIPSHDGVKVPVSLIYNKSLIKNGNNNVFILGYGSYGISITPFFSPNLLTFVNYGGIFVIPHVRGGGELGANWHKAGQKTTKPNTWKDLIATAEYLIREKYTTSAKIAIMGGSAGGILVGRAMTDRPDLFGAVITEVGCMNTLRMENSPNGPGNIPEFGTVEKEDEFKALLAMDSFHHIKNGEHYPATLITAGFNDPRVIAWQPAKFAAKLQRENASTEPILLFTDFEAGHGRGDSKTKRLENLADAFSFALKNTGHPKFQN